MLQFFACMPRTKVLAKVQLGEFSIARSSVALLQEDSGSGPPSKILLSCRAWDVWRTVQIESDKWRARHQLEAEPGPVVPYLLNVQVFLLGRISISARPAQ